MVEIFIDNKLIDLDNTNISLQKEFENVVENIPTEVEYSYTISIPASMTNKEIFGFVDTFDVPSKFSRLYDAQLYVDGTLILSGKFKMTSIESGYYKGNIYNPKKMTVSDILGDRNLNEIIPHYKPMNGLKDYDATNNKVANITTEDMRKPYYPSYWGEYASEEKVWDNHIIYPYVLYGLPPTNTENVEIDASIYTQNLEYGKHNLNEDTIFPAFNVLSVIKDIFKTEGYELVGNVFDGGTMGEFFNNLYQTFQYSYNDYVGNKSVPFWVSVSGEYTNLGKETKNGLEFKTVSKSLQIADLWSQEEFDHSGGQNPHWDGKFKYGVDNPWSCGSSNNKMITIDPKRMFTKGTSDENTGILIVPKSGWYRVNLSGYMTYPYRGSYNYAQGDQQILGFLIEGYGVRVGGTQDRADTTDLSQQPFEIQLKKGTPSESPKLYSFNSGIPCVPNSFSEDNTVVYDGYNTYMKFGESERQRRYGKNESATYVNDYSDFSISDFVCGARLGGAWFSNEWGPAGHGMIQRPNRYATKGAMLALPDVTKVPKMKTFDDQTLEDWYKDGKRSVVDGTYFQLCEEENNSKYEYAEKTAQCLVRKDSYTNFLGYNQLNNGSWDTHSNYGAVSYEGAGTCSARTSSKWDGQWNVDTVVWLEQGDTLYLEVLIPYHTYATYRHSTFLRASKWENRLEWVNIVNVQYNLEMGFINGNKDWKPRPSNGIPELGTLQRLKLTNVNQFLPTIKCNDYLEKFLKTFNLQLTMVNDKTFSIDSVGQLANKSGNVIDIDKMCNIDNAEFKPISSESTKEFKWKIDTSETGYVNGNQSPHKQQHSDSFSGSSWYDSGYTGSETITNEANSSGSVKKTESQWSYSWYKTIKFENPYYSSEMLNQKYSDVNVISDSDLWKDGMTFAAASDEKPKTNKTMRLFTLKKNSKMSGKQASYITFKGGEGDALNDGQTNTPNGDIVCNLLLPSNYFETFDANKVSHRLHLDYKKMGNKWDGTAYNNGLLDTFFNENVNGGYNIEIPIKLSNQDYANTKQGTLYKLGDGLYRVKSIEGHDINREDDATLTLTTIK